MPFGSSCWTNGSFERKSPNASSWPDSGGGTASGSLMPSPPGAAAAVDADAFPPAREGALIGVGVEPVVVGAGAVLAAVTFLGCSILSVRGTWNARTASRITPPMPA